MKKLQDKYLKWRSFEDAKYIYFDISYILDEERMLSKLDELFNVILLDSPSITVHLCQDYTNTHASKKYLLKALLLTRKVRMYKIIYYFVGAVGPKKTYVEIYSRLTGNKTHFYETREQVNEEFLKLFKDKV